MRSGTAAAWALAAWCGMGCGVDPDGLDSDSPAPVSATPVADVAGSSRGDSAPGPDPAGTATQTSPSGTESDAPGAGPVFEVGPSLGFRNLAGPRPEVGKFLLRDTIGPGVAVLDVNGDGRLDLFFPQGTDGTPAGGDAADRLFVCEGVGDDGPRYREAATEFGLGDRGYGFGALAFDFDADGDDDLLLTRLGTNILYRNDVEDGGRFVDVTADHPGLAGDPTHWSTGASAGDVDLDGDLDLYVCNYCEQDEPALRDKGLALFMGCKVPRGPHGLTAQPDAFFRNTGAPDWQLQEDRSDTGLTDVEPAYGFQPTFVDLDDDADLDLYVTCDSVFNFLFVNDGSGHFTELALPAGAACGRMGQMEAGMGLAVGHFDDDALPELYVTNFSTQSNSFYRNLTATPDDPWFEEDGELTGCGRTTWFRLAWGTSFGDFDSDGQLDLFVSNGHIYHHVTGCAPPNIAYRQPNHLFRGDGGRFVEWADRAGPAFAAEASHRGAVSADLDDDGDLDLVVARLDEEPLIALNVSPDAGRSVRVDVRRQPVSGGPLLRAVGARVTIEAGSRRVVRDVVAGSSFLGSEDPRVHVGLGDAGPVSGLTVRLPGGRTATTHAVPDASMLRVVVRPDGSLHVEREP